MLLLAIPAAYALSIRPVRKWTDVMFFFLSTKMLPAVAGLLPIYLIAQNAGPPGQHQPAWSSSTPSMNLPIAVWMMRSFLAEIPVAILEAATIDGAGLLIRRCARSSSRSSCAGHRGDVADLLHLQLERAAVRQRAHRRPVAQTAPVFLTSFVTSQGLFLAKVCAAALAVSLPVLVAGFAAQDKLVQGLSLGAVK